jgi:hypothetical protein
VVLVVVVGPVVVVLAAVVVVLAAVVAGTPCAGAVVGTAVVEVPLASAGGAVGVALMAECLEPHPASKPPRTMSTSKQRRVKSALLCMSLDRGPALLGSTG